MGVPTAPETGVIAQVVVLNVKKDAGSVGLIEQLLIVPPVFVMLMAGALDVIKLYVLWVVVMLGALTKVTATPGSVITVPEVEAARVAVPELDAVMVIEAVPWEVLAVDEDKVGVTEPVEENVTVFPEIGLA
jgi:hypothetical protein